MLCNPNPNRIQAVQVFLEGRTTRQYVGVLTRDKEGFCFEYDDNYLRSRYVIPLGPEMPLTRKTYRSKNLFEPFKDRIPPRENPAYPEYCQAMGIAVDEQDPLVLLSTIAHRGPSSFIFEPLYFREFTARDLLAFRKALKLSVREFATCFDFSAAAVTRVELGHSSGRELLKRTAIYAKFPEVSLYQIHHRGGILHTDKRKFVESWLRKQMMNE